MKRLASPPDELIRTVSSGGGIAVRAMVGTALVAEAASRHAASPTAAAAIGRALMGALLLAAGTERGETVQLQFRGDGPLGTMVAIADAEARVRGYASNPAAHPPPRDGRLEIGAAVGRGVLAVVRHHPRRKEPQSGIVPLVTGTVARDIAHYLAESEQTAAAVGLGVFHGADGSIEAAGGFLVHALAGASEEEIDRAEANVRESPGPGELVRAGLGTDAIVDRLLGDLGSRERWRSRPVYACRCSRDRAARTVALLGRGEPEGTAARGEPLEIRCEFCGARYTVAGEPLGALRRDP